MSRDQKAQSTAVGISHPLLWVYLCTTIGNGYPLLRVSMTTMGLVMVGFSALGKEYFFKASWMEIEVDSGFYGYLLLRVSTTMGNGHPLLWAPLLDQE